MACLRMIRGLCIRVDIHAISTLLLGRRALVRRCYICMMGGRIMRIKMFLHAQRSTVGLRQPHTRRV
jgi:hypothetical protein